MNHLSNTINDSYNRLSKKLLETINGISGIWITSFVTYSTIITSLNELDFLNLITIFSLFFVLFYNGSKLRNKGKQYSPLGIYLCLIGLLLLFIVVFVSSIYLTISTNYIVVLIGIAIPFAYFWYIFITVLKSKTGAYVKIFMMIGIYLICIIGIAAMFIPINIYNTQYENSTFTTTFLVSLKISYSLPEVSKYYQINILHIVQFVFCKIFDVLILGTVINLISDITKRGTLTSE